MNGVESEQIIIILGFLVVGLIVFFAAQKLKKSKLKELEQKLNEVDLPSDSESLKDEDESDDVEKKRIR